MILFSLIGAHRILVNILFYRVLLTLSAYLIKGRLSIRRTICNLVFSK